MNEKPVKPVRDSRTVMVFMLSYIILVLPLTFDGMMFRFGQKPTSTWVQSYVDLGDQAEIERR